MSNEKMSTAKMSTNLGQAYMTMSLYENSISSFDMCVYIYRPTIIFHVYLHKQDRNRMNSNRIRQIFIFSRESKVEIEAEI